MRYTTFEAFQKAFERGECSGYVQISDGFSSATLLVERVLSPDERMKGIKGHRLWAFNGNNNRKNSPAILAKQFHEVAFSKGAPEFVPLSLQVVSVSPLCNIVAESVEEAKTILDRFGFKEREINDISQPEDAPAAAEDVSVEGKIFYLIGSPRTLSLEELQDRVLAKNGMVIDNFSKIANYIVILNDVDKVVIQEMAASCKGGAISTIDEEELIRMTR